MVLRMFAAIWTATVHMANVMMSIGIRRIMDACGKTATRTTTPAKAQAIANR